MAELLYALQAAQGATRPGKNDIIPQKHSILIINCKWRKTGINVPKCRGTILNCSNVSKEPETPLCLCCEAEVFCAAEPRIIPRLSHLILFKSHFFTSFSTFGVCWEFCTLLDARMKHFHFAKIFFVFFLRFLWPRPPAGLTSVRTPRHAIPRTESEILSCKEEELTGGGMEPLTLISNFMQMII